MKENTEPQNETMQENSPLDESSSESENDQPKVKEILHQLDAKTESPMTKNIKVASAAILVVAVLAGVLTGFGASRLKSKGSSGAAGGASPIAQVAGDSVSAGDVFGSPDTDTFKDSAQGYLEKGGLDGEGSHKLLRPGGDSQTVYLTSSVTDLDKLAGMEVKVWGETFKAQKAGWLMDVGRVEVVNVDGTNPNEE